jgi:PAS domain S-box-containing protein
MGISVLYVDDEEHLRDLAAIYLKKEPDISCFCVSTVASALEVLESESFDVIISDYQMPQQDGLDLLREISARRIDIPVILFTGRGREEVAIEAFNLGATFYVQKGSPVTVQFQELIHKIRIAVDRDRTRKKLIESEQRFRSFFTHTLLGSAILDAQTKVLEMNAYACELLGLDKADLIGSYWTEILTSGTDSHERVKLPFFPLLENNQFDMEYQKPDGMHIALRIAISPVFEAGRITGYSVLISNINAERELKQRYEELVESWTVVAEHETSIRAVLNALPDSGLLLDSSGIIRYYNKTAGAFLGLSHCPGHIRFCDLLDEPEKSLITSGLITARKTGQDQVIVTHVSNRTYEWTIHPVRGTKTYEGQFVLFCRDITSIQEMSEELEASRERYRQFTEFLPQSLFELDRNGRIVYLNPHARSVFRVTQEDLAQGLQYDTYVPDSWREFVRSKFQDAFSGKGGVPLEIELIRMDGEVFPAIIQTIPIREKGKITGIRGIVIDLTDIRRKEQEKRELEEKYRTLIENAREIIIVSQDGKLKFINPLGARITKYSLEELVDRPFSLFVHPDDRQLVYDNYLRRLQDPGFQDDYLFRFIDRDGGVHWVKTHAIRILWEGRPATLNMLSEITSLIAAQEALAESESRLASVLSFLPDPTFAIAADGTVMVWNQAIEQSLGAPAEEVLGKPRSVVAHLLYGEERPLLVDLLDNPDIDIPDNYVIHARERDMVIADVLITSPKSGMQYLWGKATHLYNPKGEVIGAIESIRDITDRKQIEEDLRVVNQKLNLFSSITRHDIRNQLNLIFLAIDALSGQNLSDDGLRQIQQIESSAHRIRTFIDLAREYEEIGIQKPVWKPVLETFLSVTASMNCRVEFDDSLADCRNVFVYADPLLEKVFFNIVDNSIKYGPEVTRIIIGCHTTDEGLTIAIRDNGPGIPDEEKEMIFFKGYGKGTGLGLFLVREILGITGMKIRETGTYGKGARFEILVPPGRFMRTG